MLDQKNLLRSEAKKQKHKQQSEDIKRLIDLDSMLSLLRLLLGKNVQANEDIEIRKLKEYGRSKILAALRMQHMPHHWIMFVGNLSSKQESMLRANKIKSARCPCDIRPQSEARQCGCSRAEIKGAVLACQEAGPVAEVVAVAVAALPQAD